MDYPQRRRRPRKGAAPRNRRLRLSRLCASQRLPLVLYATFLLLPAVSALIFSSFLCDAFVYDDATGETRSFLQADYSLECSTPAHQRLKNWAFGLSPLWPVGVPVLYLVLLLAHQRAIRAGRTTKWVASTRFLWADYRPEAYLWEVLEVLRKLTLTCFVLLIDERLEEARTLVALLVSILFLSLQMATQPFRRSEDNWLATMAYLSLVVVYLTVLLLKMCEQDAEVCEDSFGLYPAELFSTFAFFGMGLLLLHLLLAALQLYLHDHSPRIIRLARAHSISPQTLVWRVLARKAASLCAFARRAGAAVLPRRNLVQLATRWPFALWHRRRGMPPETPTNLHPLVAGLAGRVVIDDLYEPSVPSFVVLDAPSLALGWSWSSRDRVFVPLVTEVAVEARGGGLGTVRVRHRNLQGELRVLRVTSSDEEAAAWAAALQALMAEVALRSPGAASHLWLLSRMAASVSIGGNAAGVLPLHSLPAAANRSNCSLAAVVKSARDTVGADANARQLEARAVRLAQATPLPEWLTPAGGSLNMLQVGEVLLSGYTAQDEIRQLFNDYANADGEMDLRGWLAFQAAVQEEPDVPAARAAYARACGDAGSSRLSYMRFAMLLLSPENRAVPPNAYTADLSQPLSHYWVATSHNSYIVGDQLTGRSTREAYMRQLLQGCRHVEIDCWDQFQLRSCKTVPVVTHGHTLCTVESFDAVASAIARTAFVTSDLPVILSLEMHCKPERQRAIALALLSNLGERLLSCDDIEGSSLSPEALRGAPPPPRHLTRHTPRRPVTRTRGFTTPP